MDDIPKEMNRGQLYLGGGLVVLGLLFLLGTLFNVNVWAFCWPVALISLGVWLVMRPRLAAPGSGVEVQLLGDINRRGSWTVNNEEIWLGVADVDLDLSEAILPPGETVIRFYGFVSDVDIIIPRSVGVAVRVNGFLLDCEIFGRDYDGFLVPIDVTSEGYAAAERRVRIENTGFVVDLKVKHI